MLTNMSNYFAATRPNHHLANISFKLHYRDNWRQSLFIGRFAVQPACQAKLLYLDGRRWCWRWREIGVNWARDSSRKHNNNNNHSARWASRREQMPAVRPNCKRRWKPQLPESLTCLLLLSNFMTCQLSAKQTTQWHLAFSPLLFSLVPRVCFFYDHHKSVT